MSRSSCHSENYSLWQIPLHQSLSIKRRNHTVQFKTAPNLNGSTTTSPFLRPTCTFSLLLSVALYSLPAAECDTTFSLLLSVALQSPCCWVWHYSLSTAEFDTTVSLLLSPCCWVWHYTISLLLSVVLQSLHTSECGTKHSPCCHKSLPCSELGAVRK